MRDHLSPIFYSGTGVILRSPQTELNVSAASSLSLSLFTERIYTWYAHVYVYCRCFIRAHRHGRCHFIRRSPWTRELGAQPRFSPERESRSSNCNGSFDIILLKEVKLSRVTLNISINVSRKNVQMPMTEYFKEHRNAVLLESNSRGAWI